MTEAEVRKMKCKDCRYLKCLHERILVCDYIAMENRRRGCPIGNECTRFVKSKRAESRKFTKKRVRKAYKKIKPAECPIKSRGIAEFELREMMKDDKD